MNYNCPKNRTCEDVRCAHHIKNRFVYDKPVSEPCKWYIIHLDRELRRKKLEKIESKI